MGVPVDEAMAMIDTDFATETLTTLEDPMLPNDLQGRRIKAGVGASAHRAVGLAWRSPEVSINVI
jgi:hypothetical protein